MWYTAVIPVLRRKRQEDLSSRPALAVYQVQDSVSKTKILQKAEPKGSVIKITYCIIKGNWMSSDLRSILGGLQMPLSSVFKDSTPPSGLHGYWRTHAWTNRQTYTNNK